LVKFLRDAIPDKIRAKTKKSDVVDICLQAWRVLDLVIFHKTSWANKLTQTQQHDLNDYIGMMERAFNHCKALVDDEVNKDYEQTEKMPLGEENHGYCEGGAVKPAKVAHRTCPKCHDPFMHDPAINIEIRKKNAQLKATWVAKNKEFERYESFSGTFTARERGKANSSRGSTRLPQRYFELLQIVNGYSSSKNVGGTEAGTH
jgi:hypothetical protein